MKCINDSVDKLNFRSFNAFQHQDNV